MLGYQILLESFGKPFTSEVLEKLHMLGCHLLANKIKISFADNSGVPFKQKFGDTIGYIIIVLGYFPVPRLLSGYIFSRKHQIFKL